MSKFELQDSQYHEPYHHYVSFESPGLQKHIRWGLRYYGYVSRVMEIVAAFAPMGSVAEVGCGDGRILLELAAHHPATQFAGYDLSEKGIAFAKAYGLEKSNLEFSARDFRESPGGYDVILCIETLEHVPDDDVPLFLATIKEKLAPGGQVILTVPTANFPVSPKHYRHYTRALLCEHIGPVFTLDQCEFLHNPKSNFLARLLVNRFFLLKSPRLTRMIFDRYMRKYRHAGEKTAQHMLAVLR